jgi:hypothetical protein
MGAWGYGMMDNDSALDAIDGATRCKKGVVAYLEKKIDSYIRDTAYAGYEYTLGIAKYCVANKIKIPKRLHKKVLECLNQAKRDTRDYRNPKARKNALKRFTVLLKAHFKG